MKLTSIIEDILERQRLLCIASTINDLPSDCIDLQQCYTFGAGNNNDVRKVATTQVEATAGVTGGRGVTSGGCLLATNGVGGLRHVPPSMVPDGCVPPPPMYRQKLLQFHNEEIALAYADIVTVLFMGGGNDVILEFLHLAGNTMVVCVVATTIDAMANPV
jgi:hypothetical protein